ncbi:MAG: hypothetical protein LBF61_06600 [Azoarcus sp.]|nr:hypothetical protein [Azoarcus sp.]
MIVIDMEDGKRGDPPENHAIQQPVEYPQPQLQEGTRLPPKAVCPPPPLDIDAFLAAFDA